MIPLRFLPSISVNRDTAAGILDNLIALGFIADATQLGIALERFFTIKDWSFVVPRCNDHEGWKEIQRRYVQPLRYEAGRLAAVLAEVSDVLKGSTLASPEPQTTAAPPTPAPSTCSVKKAKSWKPTKATKKVIALMNQGLSNNAIVERADVTVTKSAANLDAIRSRARKAGLLNTPKPEKPDTD